eukprot:109661-Chlamydomonas_euryale.AAC.1
MGSSTPGRFKPKRSTCLGGPHLGGPHLGGPHPGGPHLGRSHLRGPHPAGSHLGGPHPGGRHQHPHHATTYACMRASWRGVAWRCNMDERVPTDASACGYQRMGLEWPRACALRRCLHECSPSNKWGAAQPAPSAERHPLGGGHRLQV